MLSKKLEQIKVEVLLNTKVGYATAGFVELENKERIATKTLIWTGGVAPSPILSPIPCPRNKRGQSMVNEHLEVLDYPKVRAIGD